MCKNYKWASYGINEPKKRVARNAPTSAIGMPTREIVYCITDSYLDCFKKEKAK